jgi:hypothetical protein
VDARSYYYTDNSGLTVGTVALDVEQPVSRRVTAGARGVIDRISVERVPLDVAHQAAHQATGHHHAADMVTSASAFAAGGEVADKSRFEGIGSVAVKGDVMGAPSEVRASFRAGAEDDYDSFSGALSGRTELFDRNTTVMANVGYGRDIITPVEAPPGESALWPATHDRYIGRLTVSQLLSPSVIASGGIGVTFQKGTLENPYRRAIVRTSLFPESVPDERTRLTGFLGLSWAFRQGLAAHFRQGIYADTWGVVASIPEVSLGADIGDRVLVLGRYRFYRQTSADFYKVVYHDREALLSGDARLGQIHEHLLAVEARWTFLGERDSFGAATLLAGYEVSFLTYEQMSTDIVVAHVPTLGLSVTY